MRVVWSAARYSAVVVLSIWLSACLSASIGDYSLQAYKNATDIKAETLALVDKSDEPYMSHKPAISAVLVEIDAAYEFANGMPNNGLSAKQWEIMRDPAGGLAAGYFREWERRGRVPAFLRDQARPGLVRGFDLLICLEANKQKPVDCNKGG